MINCQLKLYKDDILNIFKEQNINYDKVYYYLILVFAFLLPLSRAAVSLFILLLPVVWLIEGNIQEKFLHIWKNNLLKSILLFLLFMISSLLWSSDISNGLHFLRLYSYWFAIFVIATSIKKEYIQSFITSFLFGMFLSELIAYGVFFEIWTFKAATPVNPSPFMFWIDYSVFMAVTSILLLSRLFSKNYKLKEKMFMLVFFLSTTVNLFLGMGRTGQVALIAGIIVMVFLYLKPNIKSFFIGIFLIIGIYGAGYTISETFQNRVNAGITDIQSMQNNKFDTSWGIRVVYWMITYDILKDNPMIGVGVGDYKDSINNYLQKNKYPISKETEEFIREHHAHNQFLMIAIQTGFIGLILMLNILYQILRIKIDDEDVKYFSILFITVYFVSCMAEPLWAKQFTIALYVLFIGLFSSYSINIKSKI